MLHRATERAPPSHPGGAPSGARVSSRRPPTCRRACAPPTSPRRRARAASLRKRAGKHRAVSAARTGQHGSMGEPAPEEWVDLAGQESPPRRPLRAGPIRRMGGAVRSRAHARRGSPRPPVELLLQITAIVHHCAPVSTGRGSASGGGATAAYRLSTRVTPYGRRPKVLTRRGCVGRARDGRRAASAWPVRNDVHNGAQ